uniref:Ribosome biogenesis protein NOP53 n=1 Tax=Strongyloides papillosus TaxID=174720 RepID=A0A0N5CHP4_STREA
MAKGRKKLIKKLRQKKENDANVDAENVLSKVHEEKKFDSLKDSDIFVEDTQKASLKILETKGLSKRKEALLKRREKQKEEISTKKVDGKKTLAIKSDEKLKKLISEKAEKLSKELGRKRQVKEKDNKEDNKYDLWDTQDDMIEDDKGYLKDIDEKHKTAIKKRRVNIPKTAKEIVNILPAVEVLPSGASYRPDEEEHNEYLSKIIKDEVKFIKEEEKVKKSLKLKEGDTYATPRDRFLEAASGLFENEHEVKEEILSDNEEGEKSFSRCQPKPKTIKQRKRAAAQKLLEAQGAEAKRKRKDENLIDKVPSISNKIAVKEESTMVMTKLRKRKSLIRKCTKTFAREDGKFNEEMEPFLLKEEVPDSMRRLNPQGNVLSSRMKSLEKRNIICGNEAKKKKLPTKLQFKFIEKRDHKVVGKGYKPL